MKCKTCGIEKSENEFYLKGHTINGKYYVNFSSDCKSCYSMKVNKSIKEKKLKNKTIKREIKKEIPKKEVVQEIKVNQAIPKKNPENVNNDLWIIRNLLNYGNCYVNKNHNLKNIEKEVGKNLIYKPYELGYIIEVVEEVKHETI